MNIKNSPEVLHTPETIKHLCNVLKTNAAACSSIGVSFLSQMARLFMDMMALYRSVSIIISDSVATKGIMKSYIFRDRFNKNSINSRNAVRKKGYIAFGQYIHWSCG